MFVNAIDQAAKFTRPIHFILRNYGSDHVQRGAGTLFFVNPDGWALTCRHITDLILAENQVLAKLNAFDADMAAGRGKKKERQLRRELEQKHGYNPSVTVEIHTQFVNCFEGQAQITVTPHPEHDLALIRFYGPTKNCCATSSRFSQRIRRGLSKANPFAGWVIPFQNLRITRTMLQPAAPVGRAHPQELRVSYRWNGYLSPSWPRRVSLWV